MSKRDLGILNIVRLGKRDGIAAERCLAVVQQAYRGDEVGRLVGVRGQITLVRTLGKLNACDGQENQRRTENVRPGLVLKPREFSQGRVACAVRLHVVRDVSMWRRMLPSAGGRQQVTLAPAIAAVESNSRARSSSNFAVSPTTSLILDVIRGLAAVAVFIGHFLNAFYVDYAGIEDKSLAARALYSTAGFGLVAVIVFS